jgi:hypothetical protein
LKLTTRIAVVSALCLLGGASLAVTPATAHSARKVKITIEYDSIIPDLDGYLLTSPKCRTGTKVTLYKQTGSSQSPSQDTKIGTHHADGDGYWYVTTEETGKFYAHTRHSPGCKAAFSKTVSSY